MNAAIEAHNLELGRQMAGARRLPDMANEPQFLREKERYLSFKGDYSNRRRSPSRPSKFCLTIAMLSSTLATTCFTWKSGMNCSLSPRTVHRGSPKEAGSSRCLRATCTSIWASRRKRARTSQKHSQRDPEVVTAYVNRGYMLKRHASARRQLPKTSSRLEARSQKRRSPSRPGLRRSDLHKSQAAIQACRPGRTDHGRLQGTCMSSAPRPTAAKTCSPKPPRSTGLH